MESTSAHDEDLLTPPDRELSPKKRRAKVRLGKALLFLASAVLILVAFGGVWQLAHNFSGAESQGDSLLGYFLALAMILAPLLLLACLVWVSARYFERLRLESEYQLRIDQISRRLNYRENLLHLVADHQPGAIAIFDRHNRYWFVNQRAADHIGKRAADIIGKPPIKVLGNDLAKRLEVRLAEARAAEAPMEYVDRMDEKGYTRFIQTHYEAIAPFAELIGGVLVSEDDLTTLIVERERRERMLRQVIETLVAVVDRRDPYASGHSSRVGQLAGALAKEMRLDDRQIETAEIAGSLMNFGKVLVSRSVLTKTAPLTAEELQRVRDSILTSADILSIIGFEGPVVPTLRQVLERYDGTGVPDGLKGDDIMVTARIVTVANAFVALVSPRAHRDGLPFKDAMRCMMAEAEKIYDQRVLIALSHYMENNPNKLDWLAATKQA